MKQDIKNVKEMLIDNWFRELCIECQHQGIEYRFVEHPVDGWRAVIFEKTILCLKTDPETASDIMRKAGQYMLANIRNKIERDGNEGFVLRLICNSLKKQIESSAKNMERLKE